MMKDLETSGQKSRGQAVWRGYAGSAQIQCREGAHCLPHRDSSPNQEAQRETLHSGLDPQHERDISGKTGKI